MKYKELAGMGKTELEEKLSQLRMDMIKANAQIATGTTPKNPGQIRQTKKTIARIKQLLNTKAEEKSNE
ncbi:50S ribosomal protein L29 [Candidatus Woesearchaeota archaeon]|nr:50S ribosomal protein L29 [Candidatus Woesearchaeota archaeon]